jgi:DNA-binding transcriptional LysR family regulator
MDRLHLMQVFVAVVDAGGLSGAARKLGLSPPAVTRAIAALESRLGVRLLTRTTRVVRVTEAGARYVDDCRRLLAEVDEADEAAGGAHATPRGRLTVTAPVQFGAMHVTPLVAAYLASYPETSVACWFVDRIVNLVEEGADVAIRIGRLPDSSAQAIRVGGVRRVICGSPEYLQQHGTPREPAELRGHTIVSAAGVTPGADWRFIVGTRTSAVHLDPRLLTTTTDGALHAVLRGVGLARLLSYQVAAALASGALVAVLAEFDTEVLPVHVVHREGRAASRRVRAFLDLAIDRLRRLPAIAV